MNAKLKYVIDELGGFMIFPDYVEHEDAAAQLVSGGHSSIVSAGFIDFTDGKVHCYGRSKSLGIESQGHFDDETIAEQLTIEIQD